MEVARGEANFPVINAMRDWLGARGSATPSGLGAGLLPLALLVAAFACGGGSMDQPLRDLVIQLMGVVVLAAVGAGWIGRRFSPDARIPAILIGLMIALFLLQLTPLPESLWSALSGRAIGADVLGLIGEPVGARPLSIQPELTVMAALATIPGIAMALAVMRLGTPARAMLGWAVVVLAVLSLLFGIAQVTLGSETGQLTLYATSHAGLPLGVFANTNHQADLLLIGFVMAGVLAPSIAGRSGHGIQHSWWIYGVMAALAAGIVATGSRTGIALLGVALLAIIVRHRIAGNVRLFVLGGGGLAIALALLVAFNGTFARSFADFSDLDDGRFHFWPNVVWAIGEFGWPGTGAGTFDGVYRSVETLDTLSSSYLNHAHNDYLEIMLEMGVPGILLLLAFVAWYGWRGAAIVRTGGPGLGVSLAHGAMIWIGLILLHSAVDYPLRTPLLSVVFGLCCALMTRAPRATFENDANVPVEPALVRS
jgi:O-antigen ligase